MTIIEEKSRMKTTQNSEREVRNVLCQNLTSFFESIKGSFTHIKHQKAVQSKELTLEHADKLSKSITYYFMSQRVKPVIDTSSPEYPITGFKLTSDNFDIIK